MLMVFTRSKNSRFYAFFRRLFRRKPGRIVDDAPGTAAASPAEPVAVYPKAAE
jgi:multidrug efflux pump